MEVRGVQITSIFSQTFHNLRKPGQILVKVLNLRFIVCSYFISEICLRKTILLNFMISLCMIRIYFLVSFLTVISVLVASGQRFDSLRQALKKSTDPIQTINTYHLLADESGVQNFAQALSYEDSALTIAKGINAPEQISTTLTNIGAIYRNISEFEKAIDSFNQAVRASQIDAPWLSDTYLEAGITLLRITKPDSALVLFERGLTIIRAYPNVATEASLYNAMGNVRREQNQYDEAMKLYIRALKLFEGQQNLQGQTQALSNISNIHNLLGDTGKAIDYAKQSLETAQAAGIQSSVAYSYRLLGRIYRKMKQSEDALDAYSHALSIYHELNARRDVGETESSMGNIYFDQRKFTQAMPHYERALAVGKAIADSATMAYAYFAMGNTSIYTKAYARAKAYADSAKIISQKKNLIYLNVDSYALLGEINEAEGDYESGLRNYRKYISIRDSVEHEQNKTQVRELEARYQSEKKDDAIRLLNTENTAMANQKKYLFVILILLLVIAGTLYGLYRIKSEANKKLRDLDLIKTRFFANISHEFRTPLSLIAGPLEKHIAKATGEDAETFKLMQRNANRLQNLINQLLDLSKIEAGSLELHLEENDLSQTLRFIGSSFSSLAERKGILYKYEIPDAFVGCYDRDKIEKICNNLLSNAFKFTPEGEQVSFKAIVNGNNLLLEVADTGIGIAEEQLRNIFNYFYQGDASVTRGMEGSGIGLALTKELVELHRGKLSVSSSSGTGSVFTATIPINHAAYSGISIHSPLPVETHDYASGGSNVIVQDIQDHELKPLVLIAEDNDDMKVFLINLLSEQYRCIACNNGLDAFERSQAEVPDLVISDWMMPKMDGLTLCEKIKATTTTSHIPVLMLTARADQASKVDGLETGADDYLVKPFDTKELLVRTQNLIIQRKKLREIFSREMVLQPASISLPSRDAEFLSRIMNLLEARYADADFSVEELASGVLMSRMQLHRKLKALTNESPGEFLRRFRLERAKQMLSTKGLQISEVCYQTGFNNLSNFSKIFKEYTGVTPTEYQATILGT